MKIKSLIKILLSLAMLTLVLQTVSFSELKKTLLGASPLLITAIILAYMLTQLLSSVKWWLIAKKGGIDTSYSATLKSYFIGMFVNSFGLGMVGGDITRGLLLSQGKPQKTPAIASVVADRLHGLVVLALIGAVAALLFGSGHLAPSLQALLVILVCAIIIGWFSGPYLLLKVIKPEQRLRRKAEQLCHVFPNAPKFLFFITFISVIFHLFQIALHALMAYTFGVIISWRMLLTVIPIVNILSSLPISWNGLGVREQTYAFFLSPNILTQEQAVGFGAIWLLAMTVCSAIGGLTAVLTKDFDTISKFDKSEDFSLLAKEPLLEEEKA